MEKRKPVEIEVERRKPRRFSTRATERDSELQAGIWGVLLLFVYLESMGVEDELFQMHRT